MRLITTRVLILFGSNTGRIGTRAGFASAKFEFEAEDRRDFLMNITVMLGQSAPLPPRTQRRPHGRRTPNRTFSKRPRGISSGHLRPSAKTSLEPILRPSEALRPQKVPKRVRRRPECISSSSADYRSQMGTQKPPRTFRVRSNSLQL